MHLISLPNRITQLEKWRTDSWDRRVEIEKFRLDSHKKVQTVRKTSLTRPLIYISTSIIFFICSFSPVFANPFQLEVPKDNVIPSQVFSSNRAISSPEVQKKKEQMASESISGKSSPSVHKQDSKHANQITNTKATAHPDKQSFQKPNKGKASVDKPSSKGKIKANPNLPQIKNNSPSQQVKQKLENNKQNPIVKKTIDGGKLPQTASLSGAILLRGIAFVLMGLGLRKL